jgi:hypothetical protein
MPWWSWALIGYAGLVMALLATLGLLCGIIELRMHFRSRRFIRDTERFLTGVVPVPVERPLQSL